MEQEPPQPTPQKEEPPKEEVETKIQAATITIDKKPNPDLTRKQEREAKIAKQRSAETIKPEDQVDIGAYAKETHQVGKTDSFTQNKSSGSSILHAHEGAEPTITSKVETQSKKQAYNIPESIEIII
jgi:hypothetical protein